MVDVSKLNKIVVGGTVALVVTLLIGAFAVAGVINAALAHILIFAAWVVAVLGISTDILSSRPVRHRMVWCLVIGVALLGIDRLMVHLKYAQEPAQTRPQDKPQDSSKPSEPGSPSDSGICYLEFVGQVINGSVAAMEVNQTSEPVDNVRMQVIQLLYKRPSDQQPTRVGYQKQLDLGTCRAKLSLGLEERFPIGNHEKLAYDVWIMTRYMTLRETIKLHKASEREYREELFLYRGADQKPIITRTATLGIVSDPRLSPSPPESTQAPRTQLPQMRSLKQRALLLANRIQVFYNEQAQSGRSIGIVSPPSSKEDAESNTRKENEFHKRVVIFFGERFGRELDGIIREMKKIGLDVTDIERAANAQDYWMVAFIPRQLRDLASQIDDQGNLVR